MNAPFDKRVRALALDGLLVVAWLASLGLVVLHEQGQLWGGLGNPLASLGATLEAKEQWFGIYYQGQKIGFSHTTLTPEERDGVPGIRVRDQGRFAFTLLGAPQQLDVAAQAFIDADWRLQEFAATVRSPSYSLRWTGRRAGDELHVTVATPSTSMAKRLRDPSGGTFVNGLSSWAAFHRLHEGQSGKAWVINPLALNPEPIYFVVRRRERLDDQEVLVVESEMGGITATSWVTPEGEVLKELSPLGWELRRESRNEAIRQPVEGSIAPDLLSATSVPIDQPLEHPERIGTLTVLIEGATEEQFDVQRPWQRVLPAERLREYQRPLPDGPWCLVQLERPTLPAEPTATVPSLPDKPAVPTSVERYRRPSPFIQSDDARIAAKAAEIVGARTEPWAQVMALNQWVFSTLRKRLTVGLPSALDVLFTMEGDCHEHTVLFTALARSLALPTRMVAGLVYWQGRLYYHAWPEVWVGDWVPTDPTLGQPLADATHVGLVEAENESLISLAQFIGRLRVQVLTVNRDP